MLRAAGAVQPPRSSARVLGGVPGLRAVPEPQEGARRAGPLPPPAVGGGGHPPGSHSVLRADDDDNARLGLLPRVKAFLTRTGLCCASSGKRKFGKRLERSIGCAGVNGGTLVGGDWRIMKVEWKQAGAQF
ncbi:hypothetical protein MJT46_018635 [Ovis ammon polii x Ovis aries]|nr:hypothetical protein MJT46_018635 [Ovis ammon polii x Ovis aries]